MSISAYVGLPGHGKSYGIVDNVIIPALKMKRSVFTNIPMTEKVFEDFGIDVIPFDPSDIVKNPNWFTAVFIAGSVFVLDEVWKVWPAGLKANAMRQQDKDFLAEHRHFVGENGFSTEIYLVTQDLSQISPFARALIETTYRMVKRSNIGLDNRFRVDVYSGVVTGSSPPKSKLENQIHGGKFKKEIYAYYKSHTKSKTGLAGNETRTDKRFNALGRLSIKLGFIFVVLCVVFIYSSYSKVVNYYKPVSIEQKTLNISSSMNYSSAGYKTLPVGVRVAVEPKQPPKFLSSSKKFTISHIFGFKPNQTFYFKVMFDQYEVLLSTLELSRLGYKSQVVNDCLVRVSGYDFDGFAMCSKSGRREPSVLAGVTNDLINPINNDQK